MSFVAIASALTASTVLALWAVSVIGWMRTRSLRRGVNGLAGDAAGPHLGRVHTSHATYLPGLAGVLIALMGGQAVIQGGWIATVLTSAGLGIAASGFAARVTALDIHPSGLVIRYRARRSFALRWDEVRAVTPPRWPLGGWRLAGPNGRRTLMGSDLFGHEDLLGAFIPAAGLRFVNGAWRPAM